MISQASDSFLPDAQAQPSSFTKVIPLARPRPLPLHPLMHHEPHIERLGAALSDHSRNQMLCALMDGRAHSAKELALCAEIAPSTASVHLAMLRDCGLITTVKSGRVVYHRLAGSKIAALLEDMAALVPPAFASKLRTAQRRDPGHLHARCCYDHIAGALGVWICETLTAQGAVVIEDDNVRIGDNTALLTHFTGNAPPTPPASASIGANGARIFQPRLAALSCSTGWRKAG